MIDCLNTWNQEEAEIFKRTMKDNPNEKVVPEVDVNDLSVHKFR